MDQIESKEQDISDVKSALNISDLIQFMKDECNSLEEEKRFLITQCIALAIAIIILLWAMVELLINQISFEFDSTVDNVVVMKVVYASLILAISLQMYRMLSACYVIKVHDDILRFIKAPPEYSKYIQYSPVLLLFIILLFHRFCPWIQSPQLEILKTSIYNVLLFAIGLEIVTILLSLIWVDRYVNKYGHLPFEMEYVESNVEKVSTIFLIIGGVYQVLILFAFIWILYNMGSPPIELLGIQFKFDLIFIAIFFSYVYLAKPLRFRLKELVMKIELFNELILDGISDKIAADGIVSKIYKNTKS